MCLLSDGPETGGSICEVMSSPPQEGKTTEGNGHVTEMMRKPFKYALRTGLDVF